MTCPQCQGIESFFNSRFARLELTKYRRKGPRKTTRVLLAALQQFNVHNLTLLDIGGGIGVIQHEMLKAGLIATTHIDASSAYIRTAREEAERLGNTDKMSFRYGDIVDCAAEIQQHDLVTLDRVICCYDNMTVLMESTIKLAGRYYGVVYPNDGWLSKLAFGAGNLWLWLIRSKFRGFVHSSQDIERVVDANGFEGVFHQKWAFWQVAVYRRRLLDGAAKSAGKTA